MVSPLFQHNLERATDVEIRFKLLLEADDPEIRRRVNIPAGLDVMDVVTDFLHALYNHVRSIYCVGSQFTRLEGFEEGNKTDSSNIYPYRPWRRSTVRRAGS